MAKKSVKVAPSTMPADVAYKPKAEARFDIETLPEGLPELKKPVRLIVEGKLTRMASQDGGSMDSMCVEVSKVTVDKGKKE